MKANMGTIDKLIRLAFAAVILILYFTNVITGTLSLILFIVAAVFILTSLLGICPAYLPFKISTRKKTEQK